MLGSDTLEIAIGLIFVYLVLSLICSAINELIEGLLNARAANLERGLRELLADPAGTGLVKAIYEHPLIHGLFKGTYDPAKTKKGMWTRRKLPSYLPPRNFALALMDAVLPATPMTASGASSSLAAAAIPPSPAGLRVATSAGCARTSRPGTTAPWTASPAGTSGGRSSSFLASGWSSPSG